MDINRYYVEHNGTRIVLPVAHINGTNRDALIEQLCAVYSALGDALDTLRQAAPNGRDYYPAGAVLMEAAQRQHDRRARMLADLRDELEAQVAAIEDRNPSR